MQQRQGKPGTTIALRVSMDQLKFLREQAKLNDRTVSYEVRRLIRREMDLQEKQAA